MLVPAVDHGSETHSYGCPFSPPVAAESKHRMGERAGLIWIGAQFYPTPEAFMAEARDMGISRRITAVPKGFEVGKTWVLLGHRRAIPNGYKLKDGVSYETLVALTEANPEVDSKDIEQVYLPGVVSAFLPEKIEYVVRPEDEHDEEFLASLEKRGIEPVKVVPIEEEALAV